MFCGHWGMPMSRMLYSASFWRQFTRGTEGDRVEVESASRGKTKGGKIGADEL